MGSSEENKALCKNKFVEDNSMVASEKTGQAVQKKKRRKRKRGKKGRKVPRQDPDVKPTMPTEHDEEAVTEDNSSEDSSST